jgi:predicted membrane protein (TIGR00267 family)
VLYAIFWRFAASCFRGLAIRFLPIWFSNKEINLVKRVCISMPSFFPRKVPQVNGLRETLKLENVGPVIRRFFINTLFDSTFMLLGIVVGSAFATDAGLNVVVVTMLTTSLALGISTGVSVWEAESLEQERKISELEKALFTNLEDTSIHKTAKRVVMLAALINFATPLLSCAIVIAPFVFVASGILHIEVASWFSVALALGTLFGAGLYLGRMGKTNPYIKGLRMVVFGVFAFLIGFLLDLLL